MPFGCRSYVLGIFVPRSNGAWIHEQNTLGARQPNTSVQQPTPISPRALVFQSRPKTFTLIQEEICGDSPIMQFN